MTRVADRRRFAELNNAYNGGEQYLDLMLQEQAEERDREEALAQSQAQSYEEEISLACAYAKEQEKQDAMEMAVRLSWKSL